MSVDSERMLKLENEVKELKTYINKIVGALKSELSASIKTEMHLVVNKDYVTNLYRNK